MRVPPELARSLTDRGYYEDAAFALFGSRSGGFHTRELCGVFIRYRPTEVGGPLFVFLRELDIPVRCGIVRSREPLAVYAAEDERVIATVTDQYAMPRLSLFGHTDTTVITYSVIPADMVALATWLAAR